MKTYPSVKKTLVDATAIPVKLVQEYCLVLYLLASPTRRTLGCQKWSLFWAYAHFAVLHDGYIFRSREPSSCEAELAFDSVA